MKTEVKGCRKLIESFRKAIEEEMRLIQHFCDHTDEEGRCAILTEMYVDRCLICNRVRSRYLEE